MSNNWYINDDTLAHHGIKGQKWGIRRYVDENGRMTALGKRNAEHDITVGVGAATAGTIGGLLAYKHIKANKPIYIAGEIPKTNLKKAIAKTALIAVGSAIVGGLLGHTVNEMKQTYESNQNKPRNKQDKQSKAERIIGKKTSNVSGLLTGKNRVGLSVNPLHPGIPVIKRRK